jgi:hypothetical protein
MPASLQARKTSKLQAGRATSYVGGLSASTALRDLVPNRLDIRVAADDAPTTTGKHRLPPGEAEAKRCEREFF